MKQLPPSFILCPIFDDVNKWNFFYPPPSQIGKCLILGNFFSRDSDLRNSSVSPFVRLSVTKLSKYLHISSLTPSSYL